MVSMSFLASFGVLFTKAPLVVTSILLLSSYKALHKNIELKIDKKKKSNDVENWHKYGKPFPILISRLS